MNADEQVIVVGGGLAGLAATMSLAQAGVTVGLVSLCPAKRSHSVCAQGGINSVNNLTRQQGDSEWKHLDDTLYGGDFLQHQPPVKEMCDWGPRIIDLMDRLGVPFNRTPEGELDRRRFGGTLYKRTVFAGATTGQQLLYALDEQVRRWEVAGRVNKYEYHDFIAPVLDDSGRCRGCVVQDLISMQYRTLPARAVVLATGGNGMVYARSTMSTICTGSAAARAFRAGAKYANGEFIQVHPTAIPGADKLRLMSESARGEGGRVWVPKKPGDQRDPNQIPPLERYYFLEERYPEYGNLVPRDIATREIFDVCVNQGLSVDPHTPCVYLDLTGMDPQTHHKLEGILEIYEKFKRADPRKTPMKIFPAVHYSMGGLWVDYEKDVTTGGMVPGSIRNHQTSIPGLYAIGEADYHYHGANRLGANSLLSCIFSGLFVAPSVQAQLDRVVDKPSAADSSLFEKALRDARNDWKTLCSSDGPENPYSLHLELGEAMTRHCTVVRRNDGLDEAKAKVLELRERYSRIHAPDSGDWANQSAVFARALGDMLILAEVIATGARKRDECRGAHYKPASEIPSPDADEPAELQKQAQAWCIAFRQRNREWLKTTIAEYKSDGVAIGYEPVDTSLIPPRPRTYGLKGAEIIEKTWETIRESQ